MQPKLYAAYFEHLLLFLCSWLKKIIIQIGNAAQRVMHVAKILAWLYAMHRPAKAYECVNEQYYYGII